MDRAERKRQAKEDEKKVSRGVDLTKRGQDQSIALTRLVYAQFERAKRERSVDAPIKYLYSKVSETLAGAGKIKLACAKGCGHCCHGWVSASAPEVLYAAKEIRRRNDAKVLAAIADTALATKNLTPAERMRQPTPCPLLKDGACTIYEWRPMLGRILASTDAAACQRAFMEQSGEPLPIPSPFLAARGVFGVVTVAALKQAGLTYHFYEFNAALETALSREDAESAWLQGEDVFAGVQRDQDDIASRPHVVQLHSRAFA
jgi:uncharacterized protein